jgi:hypothetical protein
MLSLAAARDFRYISAVNLGSNYTAAGEESSNSKNNKISFIYKNKSQIRTSESVSKCIYKNITKRLNF